MKHKFWFSYLALVLLLSGLAYVAISDDADVPLALSDSEMTLLQATGVDERCRDNMIGCNNTTCDPAFFFGTAKERRLLRKCMSATNWICNSAGFWNDQDKCEVTYYVNHCQTEIGPAMEHAHNCTSNYQP